MYRTLCLLILSTSCAVPVLAQNCPLPPALHPLPLGRDIFTDEQESDLGDILSDSLVKDESVIADDALSAHVQQVGLKIARYLPENHFRLQFSLIELPEANAFSLPGGRVYVSRKLVASLKSDDELAGILAHELGHVVTHQAAIFMTDVLRQVLGATSVAGRDDIADKVHRVSETWAARKLHIRDSEEQDQLIADQVALYALARAGFRVQAFAEALDRTVGIRGKTGNWITDVFHTTKPEERRLREVINSISSMPAGCIVTGLPAGDSGFTDWQLKVTAYKQPLGHEQLTGVLFREKLAQPLRPNVFNVHFSLDGKYILAQDEGGIHVLTQNPLKYLFFIETSSSYRAFFTPDSQSIVFYTPDLRIETWNIATQQRVLVREMALNVSCIQTALAPDGKSLACYDGDDTLWLFDTATGSPIVERKNFLHPGSMGLYLINYPASDSAVSSDSGAPFRFVHLGFSPDGKYLLAGGLESAYAYDLIDKREASVGRGVRNATKGQFVFLGNDRLAAVNLESPSKSPVMRFPSGEEIQELPLAAGAYLQASTSGDYLIGGPTKDFALALIDLKTKSSLARIKFDAADIYGDVVALEGADGNLSLVNLATRTLIASLMLQSSSLSLNSRVTVSSDFQWLAASTNTRGAIWNLSTNTRSYSLRDFRGGWFADGPFFYADFPKFGNDERAIEKIDLSKRASQPYTTYTIGTLDAQQFGRYLLVTTHPAKTTGGDKNWTFELRDFREKTTVWTRKFDREYPIGRWNTDTGQALFQWNIWQSAAKEELRKFPNLKSVAEDSDYFFEVLDLNTELILHKLLVKTNKRSFFIVDRAFDGDWLAVTTNNNEVVTYSLGSGEQVGHVFGYSPIISSVANLLVVAASETRLNVYDLSTTDFRNRFKFAAPVAFWAVSADGKRLFALTTDQTAYVLDLSMPTAARVTSATTLP